MSEQKIMTLESIIQGLEKQLEISLQQNQEQRVIIEQLREEIQLFKKVRFASEDLKESIIILDDSKLFLPSQLSSGLKQSTAFDGRLSYLSSRANNRIYELELPKQEFENGNILKSPETSSTRKPRSKILSRSRTVKIDQPKVYNYETQIEDENIGDKIFEHFFVIGPDLDEIRSSNINVLSVNPQFLLTLPQNLQDKYEMLPHHIFSNGVQAEKTIFNSVVILVNNFSTIRVILQTSSQQKSQNEFIFTLKEVQDYSHELNINPLLKESNPNLFKYCVCFQFDDFYNPNGGDGDVEIWNIPIVYCFLTYYPFISFFQDMNAQIRNIMKSIRYDEFSSSNNISKIFDVDINYSLKAMKHSKEIEQMIRNLQITRPKFDLQYSVDQEILSGQILKLSMPTFKDASFLEIDWSAEITFSFLCASKFWFLFTALILEQHVILISTNQCYLSATMLTLLNLLRPFKYPFPICFALPINVLNSIELFTPFFFGIKGNYFDFKEEFDSFDVQDTIYVDLDNMMIHYSPKQTYDNLNDCIPDMRNVFKEYKKVNPSKDGSFSSYQEMKMSQKKSSQSSPAILSKSLSFMDSPLRIHVQDSHTSIRNVFSGFQSFMNDTFVKRIPHEPYFIRKNHADVQVIIQKMKTHMKNTLFTDKFLETQTFSYYIDDNYHRYFDT